MVLRLKVRHSLGEKTISLSETDAANRPVVFGRERGVDVVVASMRVAPRHCAIFYHRASGRWVLQDGNTRGGTSLNGVALPNGRRVWALQLADAFTLGDDPTPVTITVDAIDRDEMNRTTTSQKKSLPAARDASEWSGQHDLDGLASAARSIAPPAARRSTWPTVILALLIAIIVAAGAFSLWWVWLGADNQLQPAASRNERLTLSTQPANDVMGGLSLPPMPDTESGPMRQPADEPAIEAEAVDPAGVAGVVAGVAPDHPLRATVEWDAVVRARQSTDRGLRLQAYQQYVALPDTVIGPLREVVALWLDESLDELWWHRIAELFAEEDELTRAASATELELRGLGANADPADVASLTEQMNDIRRRLTAVSYALSVTMAYTEALAPDVTDSQAMDRLRSRRDAERFEVWRREVLRETLVTGQLPWDKSL